MPITHLISLEVVHVIDPVLRTRVLPTLRNGAVISMLNIKVVIYVAAEVCRTMEPRTSTNKNPAGKPLRTIVPVGRTTIGSVTIRTYRRDANVDANLGICLGSTRQQTQTSNSR
jgi:hypothetical protein